MENEQIVAAIVEGIQDKKGKGIVLVDMTQLPDAPCSHFVICQGDSAVQVNAIALSIRDYVRDTLRVKPFAIDGFENCQWVAMDYGQIIVHVFQRETREFYDIEHLWEDARLTQVTDVD